MNQCGVLRVDCANGMLPHFLGEGETQPRVWATRSWFICSFACSLESALSARFAEIAVERVGVGFE
jgi:hypothetical protein